MHGKVDPAILASLPPSMQLDLLVQMRERLMAENRQKYQKVKKAPERFSELQIQSYLKTVAFRREIDAVQKSAAGRGIGGVQTSRIASEANREFIFSSSFTGDKRVLSSVGQDKVGADQSQPSTSNRPSSSVNKVETSNKSTAAAEINVSEPAKAFHDDVETYVDERGRTRLSRVRALGIRMTRDLQRNLDLIKEIDQEKELNDKQINAIDARKNVIDIPDIPFERKQHEDYGDEEIFEADDDVADASEEHATVTGNNAIEISFEHTGKQENEDDDFFARLVAGDNSASAKQSSSSSSDCEWEEGVVEGVDKENIPKEPTNDEEEIEWEDGSQDMQLKPQLRQDENESRNKISKGVLQEESDIQEAIRRSLEDSSIYVNEPREDHHIPERLTHVTSENDDVLGVVEKTVETEDATVDESQPFIGFINKSSNNNVEANSAPIAEVKPDDRSDSKSKFSNQQGCSSGVFSEEGLVASDSMHAEMGSSLGGEHEDRVNCGESGLGSTMKDLESSDREEVSLDSSNLKVKSSFTELFSERSIDHMSADQNLINDDFNKPADVPKASQVFNAEVNTHGEFCVEEEETAQGSPLIEVSQHDITEEHLNEEMMFLDKEREELSSKQKKLERNAESVSSEMFAECQELLQMFGLPYIIAPMEAEAQCAFMELSNLVDGVVTDDSDAFLFGARNVYKNIFDDRKYVETYLMKDIEDELGLDREKLIHMALLLGSDYTEGISGIGIVNAIEVVNAFPGKDGLREFREWIESPDPTILGIADLSGGKNSRKKVPKRGENPSDANATEGVDDEERIRQIFMDKHRNVSKNWHIPSSFPSDMVISAYDSPQVDRSTEPFSWGKPDLFVLRKLCWEKFGWNNTKADELLLPVLKEYNKHETQLRLEAFYTFNERFAKIRSKRIKKAVKGISGNKVSELTEDKILPQSGYVRKRKSKHSASDETIVDAEFAGPSDRTTTERQVKLRLSEKKNSQRNAVQSTCADDEVIATRESDVRRRRGRGRGQPSGTRKRKKNAPNPESESSHDDSDTDEEVRFNISEGSSLVRRSERTRKTINYTVSDESDDQRDEHEDRLDREETTDMALVCDTVDGCAQGNSKKELNEDSRGICSVDETKKVSMTVGEINNDETNGGVDLDQSSKSYLQFGGGFCEDDDDHDDEHAMSPVDNEIFTEESDFKSVAEENREGVRSFISEKLFDVTVKDKVPNDDDHSTNDSADETGTRFRGSLRAMPGLRRKKPRT